MIDVLAELAHKPPATWRAELRKRYDEATVTQAMMWLHAQRAQAVAAPTSLGGRYELGAKIDGGATAEVWRAYDRRLDRQVAIKLFRFDRSPVLAEILAEARAASDLVSDHVVRVFDVHDAEPPYIVMELIAEHAGGTLAPGASAAAEKPADAREATRWLRDIARGVADAHLRNVFHRDLKPHNVLIAPVSRRARIADFGLAAGATSDRIRVVGTPEYIAPEQARGLPARLSPEADRETLVAIDVWGLGAIGYDLLVGQPPWRPVASGRAPATSAAEGPRGSIDGMEAWEVAAAATAVPALPRTRLGKVIAKAMALHPEDRYASAAIVADELDRVLAHRPTSLDRSPLVRAGLWTRRNPQLALTGLLALALATVLVVGYRAAVDVREQRNQLAVEMEQARAANAVLAQRAATTRSELEHTEKDLAAESTALRVAKADYDAIVQAKEAALAHADTLTSSLAARLATLRDDQQTAEHVRDMYETFWTHAREEATRLTGERDAAVKDRDALRGERDELARKLEAAQAERAHAQEELAAAISARDRAESARRRAELDALGMPHPDAGVVTDAPPGT